MLTTKQIVDVLNEKGINDPADLDEMVIECKSDEASSINNCGFNDQIEYLVKHLGLRDILARLNLRDILARLDLPDFLDINDDETENEMKERT